MLFPHDLRLATIGWRHCLGLTVAAISFAVVLAEGYRWLAVLVEPPWLAALVLNSCLAMVLWLAADQTTRRRLRSLGPWQAYLPAAAVLVATGAAAFASRAAAGQNAAQVVVPPAQWAFVLLVPVAEELVFRGGLSQWLRRYAPPLWAIWFSALTFALVHASPTLAHLLAGSVGLALGPFLLGLACGVLLMMTGSVVPGVVLHMCCNATVVIFTLVDARWLDWLSLLYQ